LRQSEGKTASANNLTELIGFGIARSKSRFMGTDIIQDPTLAV